MITKDNFINKMPKRTREEKIVIQGLNFISRARCENRSPRVEKYLNCAIATLETLLIKDDDGVKNDSD